MESAVASMQRMSHHARALMQQAIEHSGVKRHTISAAATTLENHGFVFISRDADWNPWTIKPSLWGEEALHRLERRERKQRRADAQAKVSKARKTKSRT